MLFNRYSDDADCSDIANAATASDVMNNLACTRETEGLSTSATEDLSLSESYISSSSTDDSDEEPLKERINYKCSKYNYMYGKRKPYEIKQDETPRESTDSETSLFNEYAKFFKERDANLCELEKNDKALLELIGKHEEFKNTIKTTQDEYKEKLEKLTTEREELINKENEIMEKIKPFCDAYKLKPEHFLKRNVENILSIKEILYE